MSYEDKYLNLDFRWAGGGHRRLLLDKIPPEYLVCNPMGQRKAHFVHELYVSPHPNSLREQGRAICGIRTQEIYDEEEIKAINVCEDCLKKMDKKIGNYFWDEMNEEYYDPRQEHV